MNSDNELTNRDRAREALIKVQFIAFDTLFEKHIKKARFKRSGNALHVALVLDF